MGADNTDILFQIWDKETNTQYGALDVLSAVDFPVAMTYNIKDIMDIKKSKGSFTKTFKIPATRNNSEVLSTIFVEGTYEAFKIIEGKVAKIYCESQLIMQGGFKIKGVVQDKMVQHYECVVFGENFAWVNALDAQPMCDIDLEIGNHFPNHPIEFHYNRTNIMNGWSLVDGYDISIIDNEGRWFVFPLVNTGKWNYGDKVDYTDLIPAWFIKNLVVQIFAGQGYTLVSDFMDTTWFNKLVTLFPIAEGAWEIDVVTTNDNSFNANIGQTEWKIPVHYRNPTTAAALRFHGAIPFNDLSFVPPNLNNNNQWSSANLQPRSKGHSSPNAEIWDFIGTYGGFDVSSFATKTIAGWYWKYWDVCNGYGNLPPQNPSLCNGGLQPSGSVNWVIAGYEWSCMWEYLSAAPAIDCINPPETFDVVTIADVAVFQAAVVDTYQFTIELETEMDYNYIVNNEPYLYDCPQGTCGTEGGFWGYHNSYGFNDSYSGEEGVGDYYHHRLWLMHEHAADKYTEAIFLDTNAIYNSSCPFNAWGANNASWQLTYNHVVSLSAANFTVNITDLNDRFWFYVEVTSNSSKLEWNDITRRGSCQCKYRINGGTLEGGILTSGSGSLGTDVTTLLPCDTTQLDFVNGLTGLFNLYWQADEVNKTITVEPRDAFFKQRSEAVDWSDKITMDKPQHDKFIYDVLNRDVCFTYENDGADGFVAERNALVGQICELDSYAMDLGELYKDKESKLGTNFFCPTYMFRDGVIGTNQQWSPYIPVIHGEYTLIWTNTDPLAYPDKVEDFGARVLFWAGMTPPNLATGSNTAYKWRWTTSNPSDPPVELTTYPLALTHHDMDEQFMGNIIIGGNQFFPTLPYIDLETANQQPPPVPLIYDTCQGLYTVFWERNIETLIQRPRLKTAYFKLDANDIGQLDLSKLIYLDSAVTDANSYWIINKIADYKPNKNELTKVELYQYIPSLPEKGRPNKKYIKFNTVRGQQTKDYLIGNNRALENNMGKMGVLSNSRFTKTNNPITNPLSRVLNNNGDNENGGYVYNPATQGTGGRITGLDGTQRINTQKNQKGTNVGFNNNVVDGAGQIAIGKELRNLKSNVIYIGKGSGSAKNSNPIQILSGQQNPAIAIDRNGNVLEGGGGCIMAMDASGNYYEVYSLVDTGRFTPNINVRKILKSN